MGRIDLRQAVRADAEQVREIGEAFRAGHHHLAEVEDHPLDRHGCHALSTSDRPGPRDPGRLGVAAPRSARTAHMLGGINTWSIR